MLNLHGDQFEDSWRYNAPQRFPLVRVELGRGEHPIDLLLTSCDLAREIYRLLFGSASDVSLGVSILVGERDHPFRTLREYVDSFRTRGIPYPRQRDIEHRAINDSLNGKELYVYEGVVPLKSDSVDRVIWTSCARDQTLIEPSLREVDFTIFANDPGIMVQIYDDRGMNIWAREAASLDPVADMYGNRIYHDGRRPSPR